MITFLMLGASRTFFNLPGITLVERDRFTGRMTYSGSLGPHGGTAFQSNTDISKCNNAEEYILLRLGGNEYFIQVLNSPILIAKQYL